MAGQASWRPPLLTMLESRHDEQYCALMPFRWSLNLFGMGSIEYEPDQVDDATLEGRQPRYDQILSYRSAVETAIASGQMRELAQQLMNLGFLVSPNGRQEALHLHRRLQELAGSPPEKVPTDEYIQARDDLFEKTLTCALRMSDEALGRLIPHEPKREMAPNVATAPAPERADRVPDSRNVVELNQVRVRQGKRDILRNVDLVIRAREIIGLTGRNGAGKTTFLHLLAGDRTPDSGSIVYPALQARYSKTGALDDSIYSVPQVPNSWPGSLELQLRVFAAMRGIQRTHEADQVGYVMELLDLSKYASFEFSKLSAGYRIRTELAMAMLADPSLLLLDEPLGQLDAPGKRWYLNQLQYLSTSPAWNTTIIISAQETVAFENFADKVLIIDDGEVADLRSLLADDVSVYEVITDRPLETFISALEGVPVEIDLDVTPPRVQADRSLDFRVVWNALEQRGHRILYFRDISRSAERFLGARK